MIPVFPGEVVICRGDRGCREGAVRGSGLVVFRFIVTPADNEGE